jgi:hypothetical protein
VQKSGRQDAPVSDDDGGVRIVRSKERVRLCGFELRRLLNCETVREGELFNGRCVQVFAASGRFIRLRPHSGDLVSVGQTTAQGRHGRFRRAHENETHKIIETAST